MMNRAAVAAAVAPLTDFAPTSWAPLKDSRCALDTDKRTVQFFRVPYDVAKTQSTILKAGLPQILASRLEYGT